MAVSLESLRAQLACLHGRLGEQEHALAQSARDIEHANAKQRRAQRQAEDNASRADLAEKQLEVTRRELARSQERVERLELAAVAAADAHSAELQTGQEQLLLLARACREHEEQAAAAAAREAALRQHCTEAERWAEESAKRFAACEHRIEVAAAAASAREEGLLGRLEDAEGQLRQNEASVARRQASQSRELAAAKESVRIAESHAVSMELLKDEIEGRLHSMQAEVDSLRERYEQRDKVALEQARAEARWCDRARCAPHCRRAKLRDASHVVPLSVI